MKGQVLLAS